MNHIICSSAHKVVDIPMYCIFPSCTLSITNEDKLTSETLCNNVSTILHVCNVINGSGSMTTHTGMLEYQSEGWSATDSLNEPVEHSVQSYFGDTCTQCIRDKT